MTAAAAGRRPTFSVLPRSFRGRMMLVVGMAVLVSLLLSGGIALWNVGSLSRNASAEIERGLTRASEEYIRNYIETTALRAETLFEGVFAQVDALAYSMQLLIDNPDAAEQIAAAITGEGYFADRLVYDEQGDWVQNSPGAPSVVSVWGYLLDEQNQPRPEVDRVIRESAIFDLIGVGLMETGPSKLQTYYAGPKDIPIFRTTPYTTQAQTFDELYPGHNEANWWDFFFPGIYEAWQGWVLDPSLRPVDDNITGTAPYVDAITGATIVSYFHPLWTQDRTDVEGMVGIDISLDQLAELIDSVRVAETGFAFITMSNGNVLAVSPEGEQLLGLSTESDGETSGVSGQVRGLFASSQAAIASLTLPEGDETEVVHLDLEVGGEPAPYVVALRRLAPVNLWNSDGSVVAETFTLAFVVPEREIYATLAAARQAIDVATENILTGQVVGLAVLLALSLIVAFAIAGRMTAGLTKLGDAARRLQGGDYSVRVDIPSHDEIGEVGSAFNGMAEEIRQHTENLEHMVAQRTEELAVANQRILSLNEKLRNENTRLGAELDVARRVQSMVLPRPGELSAIDGLDIAAYMQPAEEVGGDYYDVLAVDGRVKIGIGDVTGHGLESGVLMLMVQSVARALQESGELDPKRFLEVLNRTICKNALRTDSDKHLTLSFLDYTGGGVTLTGQHEEAIVVRADGAIERIDTMDLGFPVGLEPEIGDLLASRELDLDAGDVVVLYTDGITEARGAGDVLFGFDRLAESAARHSRASSAEAIVDGIISDLMVYVGERKMDDDVTLVVMRQR